MFLLKLALLPVLVLLTLPAVRTARPPTAPPPRVSPIGEWVRQLGSDDFNEREAALQRLSALARLDPPQALLDATKSGDPEVRGRATEAINRCRALAIDRIVRRGRDFAVKGQVDLYVAASAAWALPADTDALWSPVFDLATSLRKRVDLDIGPATHFRSAFASTTGYRKHLDPRFTRSDTPHEQELIGSDGKLHASFPGGIIAPAVTSPRALISNLIVSRGDVTASTTIVASIIYANGHVSTDDLRASIVVADGDVEVKGKADRSLVIARGNITIRGPVAECVLISAREVKLAVASPRAEMVVKTGVRIPLGFLSFFELSTVGAEFKAIDGRLSVAAVDTGKPFGRAGVKAGDIITTVDGGKPDSVESLRRLLRDALAVGDATVVVRRGDATHTVKVSLPD